MRYLLFILLMLWPPCVFAQGATIAENSDQTVIEGTLIQVSKLPPAESNSYPDCYYTSVIEIAHILSGNKFPRKAVLVLPGFFGRKYAPEARYKVGDKIHATVVPFAGMPDHIKQIQQADDIEDVDLEFYFPQKIESVTTFQNISHSLKEVGKRETTGANIQVRRHFQGSDQKASNARNEAIKHDLEEINRLLAEHGGDWDKWYESLKDFREKYRKENEARSQRWVGDSFFSAGTIDNGKVYSSEFIKSVIAFKDYLATRGVDLILVRVPKKGEIVDDLFVPTSSNQVANPYLLRMYKELLEADVEIITDIIPRAKEARLQFPLMYWYQDFTEDHPAEGISWVIAEEFARRVRRYDRVNKMAKKAFALKKGANTEGWLSYTWPSGNPKFRETDYSEFSTVVDDNGSPVQLKQGVDSPILLIGSSFVAVPSLAKGSSIPHYLTYQTGIAVDLMQRYNSDFMFPRNIAREGDEFLRKKTVCLFPIPPFVAYSALASLPIFDTEKSSKVLLGSYSGKEMRKMIDLNTEQSVGIPIFSKDDTISIPPSTINRAIVSSFRIKLPQKVLAFTNFVITLDFLKKDRSDITVKYSDQKDVLKRNEKQTSLSDSFAFVSRTEDFLTVEITPDRYLDTPTILNSVKIYGVTQPTLYNVQGAE